MRRQKNDRRARNQQKVRQTKCAAAGAWAGAAGARIVLLALRTAIRPTLTATLESVEPLVETDMLADAGDASVHGVACTETRAGGCGGAGSLEGSTAGAGSAHPGSTAPPGGAVGG